MTSYRLQAMEESLATYPAIVAMHEEQTEKAEAEVARLRHGLELIVRESEQFPDQDGIGAGVMARNVLNG